MNNGLLVVERNLSDVWKNLPSSDRKRLLNYRGYSGYSHWPKLEQWISQNNIPIQKMDGFVSAEFIDNVNKYVSTLTTTVDVLFILTDAERSIVCEHFIFLGFDYGAILDEDGEVILFSVLLNEVRPGGNTLLQPFLDKVNDYYLLADFQSCGELGKARTQAFATNKTSYLETAISTTLCRPSMVFLQPP